VPSDAWPVSGNDLGVAAALRARFRSRQPAYGAWLSIGHPEVAAIFASARGHFVGIDLEHTTIDLPTSQQIIRACHQYRRACLPRIFPGDLQAVRRLLDAGADGIIVPQVSTIAHVEAVADVMRYPPEGRRGFGVAAAQEYGRGFDAYMAGANAALSMMIQVETVEGVGNIEALVAHPAVDAVMVGPYDLSGSLGVPGKIDHPSVVAACRDVTAACRKRGIACGMHLVYPDLAEVRDHLARDFTFLIMGSDIFNLWRRCVEVDRLIEQAGQ
jgi:2-keto-3-deoxy-L-rhamnonate aldolase RhmA